MSIALITPYRPFFQAVTVPAQIICAVALKILGCLFSFFGANEWGKTVHFKAAKIDSRCESLLQGLWAYGRRFLVASENSGSHCRGSCYWLIDQHFRYPEVPLTELAKVFEDGAPPDAALMHDLNAIPANLIERKLWSHRNWLPMPALSPGVYTFLIGFSEDENTPQKAHRVSLFIEQASFLFDPNTGLSEWKESDWLPLLERIGANIRTSRVPTSFFTVECYTYFVNR